MSTAALAERPAVADPGALHHVRESVQGILRNTPSYWQLDDGDRRELAYNMVKAGAFITGAATGVVPEQAAVGDAPPMARELAMGGENTAGEDLTGAAATQGSEAYTSMIQRVDFPKFVAGLIDGVFNAIVTASIKQMEAYAELLKNVAKSVDEYMKDNVSENNARDYLAEQYPDHLELDATGEQPVLQPREGADEESMPDFFSDLGLPAPVDSLDAETTEQVLVPAARRKVAMDRQQLLATMVLMGINRLVVTDGSINASVMFELSTRDSVTAGYNQASTFDSHSAYSERGWAGWFRPMRSDYASNFQVTTTRSESSQAQIDMHAKLGGKVDVRFRSETFPLDRMAEVLGVETPAQRQAAAAPAQPAPPAQPALPGAR